MYQGKYGANKRTRKSRKPVVALISLTAILICMVGGTLAYLVDSKNVTNTFEPGEVTCKVVEDFTGTSKNSVKIENTGNTEARIRVRIVATWQDDEGNVYGGAVPSIVPDIAAGWTLRNGYYEYNKFVSPGKTTGELLASPIVSPKPVPAGYHLVVEILADAIQYKGGADWGVFPN